MNLCKISDVAKELQTDDLKLTIYRLIDQFVKKHQHHYYVQYKGSLDDLVTDFYIAFTAPKKHRNGEVFSELDRYDGAKLGGDEWTSTEEHKLAAYVQRFVINRLIDKSRTDHSATEVRAQENYDDEEGGNTFDRLNGQAASDDEAVLEAFSEGGSNADDQSATDIDTSAGKATLGGASSDIIDLLNDPDNVLKARDTFDEMSTEQKAKLAKMFAACGDDIDPRVKAFMKDLLKPMDPLGDVREDIEDILPEGASIQEYSLQKKPAIRVIFPSREERDNFEDKEMLDQLLDEAGYEFYKGNGSTYYYFKNYAD